MWLHQFYTALAHSHSSHPLPTVHIIVHCTTCDAINFEVQLDSFDRWHVLYRKERLFESYLNVHDSVKHDRGIRKKRPQLTRKFLWKSSLLTLPEPYSLSKKVLDLRDFRANRFPLKWSLVEDVECPIKERKKERKEKDDGKKRKRMLAFCAFLEKMPHSSHGPNADLSLNAWFKPTVQ